jgi:hypothetical protein
LRNGSTNHHVAKFDWGGVGWLVTHPASHVRVERQVFVAQQHLVFGGFRDINGFQSKCVVVRFSLGALGERELPGLEELAALEHLDQLLATWEWRLENSKWLWLEATQA